MEHYSNNIIITSTNKMTYRIIIAFSIASACLLSVVSAQTKGYYIEETVITAMEEGQADSSPVKIWIAGDKFRRVQGDSLDITIGRLDKGLFWNISPQEKTYSVIDLETMRQLGRFTMAMMGAQIDKNGNLIIPDDLYLRTGEKKKIGAWNAEKVALNKKYRGMMENFALWISSECGAPPELYSDLMRHIFGDPNSDAQKLFKLWKQLNGYPVTIEMSMMGMKQTTITQEISSTDIPDKLFELPAGLTEVENPMKDAFQRMHEE